MGNRQITGEKKFTWTIENFSEYSNCTKQQSKTFQIHGWKWRVHVDYRENHFSMCLEVADSLPAYGWSRFAYFKLALINQLDLNKSVVKGAQKKFNAGCKCWSSVFLHLKDFYYPNQGFLVNDKCIIEAHIFLPEIAFNINIEENIRTQRNGESGTSNDLTLSELIDIESLCEEEAALIPLLEQACSWHPSLLQSQRKRVGWFRVWAFTTLGHVLYFLKTRTVRDMNEEASRHLQDLWEGIVKYSGFDLTWLEPYVQFALGASSDSKAYLEREKQLKKLRRKVDVARRDLEEVERSLRERDTNVELGYGMF